MSNWANSSSISNASINKFKTLLSSAWCFSLNSSVVITFNVQPVNCVAKRTFWPLRPIACAKLASSTAISIACLSSSTTIELTSAGAIALITNCAGLSSQRTISTRSPPNSLVIACTREPRIPTQAPTGSIRLSLLFTAILAREPGSRAALLISINSSPISGTSKRNNSTNISGFARVTNNCAPLLSGLTLYSTPRTRSPGRKFSRGNISSRNITASALLPSSPFTSKITLSRLLFFTVAVTICPSFARNWSTILLRSASRILVLITWRAVCMAIRSKAMDSIWSST